MCSVQLKSTVDAQLLRQARTWVLQSMASCCMSSDMSAFLITALRSDILWEGAEV